MPSPRDRADLPHRDAGYKGAKPSNPGRPTKIAHQVGEARGRPDFHRDQPPCPHTTGGYKGTVVCGRCHAIWNKKRWHLNEEQYRELVGEPTIASVVCPACHQIEWGEYDGVVTLRSPLIPANQAAIEGLIRHTEADIRTDNPLARIASLKATGDTIEILTITPFLAERIGKELQKAYDGELEVKAATCERFVRVTWLRP